MKILELTRPDGSPILVNKNGVVTVVTYGDNTVLLFSGGHRQEVKESYNEIKALLIKEEKDACGCK